MDSLKARSSDKQFDALALQFHTYQNVRIHKEASNQHLQSTCSKHIYSFHICSIKHKQCQVHFQNLLHYKSLLHYAQQLISSQKTLQEEMIQFVFSCFFLLKQFPRQSFQQTICLELLLMFNKKWGSESILTRF